MFNFWETLAIAIIPAAISFALSYWGLRYERKKYFMDTSPERAAKHFLEHSSFTDRNFKTLQKYLGGWDKDEDELRRILVRAGAVRTFRQESDGTESEWWTLLSRIPEKIEKQKKKSAK